MKYVCKQIIIMLKEYLIIVIMILARCFMNVKSIISLIMLLGISGIPAYSSVSVDTTTSPEYLINSGYSKATAEHVSVVKARANGVEYYTDDEEKFAKQNAFVRFFRKLYMYTDPASENYSLYHHSINTTPKYTDF